MSGVALPMKLAVAPVVNTEEDFRPSITVKKGPLTTNQSITNASSYTDSTMNFQGIIPPNDMTCLKRNLEIQYEVLVKVLGVPNANLMSTISDLTVGGTAGFGNELIHADLCVPLPYPLLQGDTQWSTDLEEGATDRGLPISSSYIPGLALRALPLQTISSSIVLTINGTSITYPARDVAPLLPYLNWIDLSKGTLSTVPFYPSEGPIYREPAAGSWQTYGDTYVAANKTRFSQSIHTYNPDARTDPFGMAQLYFSENSQLWQTGGRSVQWQMIDYSATTAYPYTLVARHDGATPTDAPTGGIPTTTTSTVLNYLLKATVRECIPIGPFRLEDAYKETGITRINNLSLQLNYNNPAAMLACACEAYSLNPFSIGGATGTTRCYQALVGPTGYAFQASLVSLTSLSGAGTTYTNPPQLNIEFNTADPITQSRSPNFAILPTEIYQTFKTSGAYVAPAAGTDVAGQIAAGLKKMTITLPAIRSTFVPSKYILYFAPSPTSPISTTINQTGLSNIQHPPAFPYIHGTNFDPNFLASKVSNHYLRIHSISVNAFDRVALGSTWSETNLYQRAQRNGYRGSFDQWSGAWGSIVILDLAEDLCLGTAMAAGQNTNSNIQVTVTVSASSLQRSLMTRYDQFVNGNMSTPAASICPWESLTYDATQLLLYNGSCVVGAGQMTVTQEGPTEAQVLRLLQMQKRRMKTTEMPSQLTAGSLGQERTMTADDDDPDEGTVGGQSSVGGGSTVGGGMKRGRY